MPSRLKRTIYTGTFIHTPTLGNLEIIENSAIGVDENGIIRFIEELSEDRSVGPAAKHIAQEHGWDDGVNVVTYECRSSFWFPGFVDTHIHASQLPNAGIFGTTTLLDWLETYTFPLESSLSSLDAARRVYNTAVRSTLAHGTTTAAYYATIHAASTNLLADTCLEMGQRAFVGNVCMDSKETCPDYYRHESAEASLASTKQVVDHIKSKDPEGRLVQPIVTPRFAPSCTKPLLNALGTLAKDEGLAIQTHISENKPELALVRKMFPEHSSYAYVYDSHGLLTAKTVLAHGIHLSDEEIALIRNRGSGVSHCPVSNTSLGSGICPVRKLLEKGIEVGLGTDVSGGGSCSILTAAREAAGVSRLLSAYSDDDHREKVKLTVNECLYLATRGGANCLGLGRKVGAFEVGMQWDAQTVHLYNMGPDGDPIGTSGSEMGFAQCWGKESWEEKVAKWMYTGDDRNTTHVYVRGRLVHERVHYKSAN
ncbi:MAG: hypothetical protein Q9212_002964 [Teloschistes hypoglaucus]